MADTVSPGRMLLEASGGAGFADPSPMFEGATTLPALVASLANTYRPAIDVNTAPVTIYVSAAGNDSNAGTAGSPLATIKRATQLIAINPATGYTIQLQGAGPFPLAGTSLQAVSNTLVLGDTPTVLGTRTVSGVGASSAANGLVLTDTGVAMGIDAHRGKMIRWTSGVLNNSYGIIGRNGANTVEVTQDTTPTFKIPAPGDTYQILDWVSEIVLTATTTIESSVASAIRFVRFTGTQFLFCNDTDKLDFDKCKFEIATLLTGRGGSAFLTTCSVANSGQGFSEWGMVCSVTEGIMKCQRGTFIDGGNAGAVNYISGLILGTWEWQGETMLRDTSKVLFRTSDSHTRRVSIAGAPILRFLAGCAAGVVVNTAGEGAGGSIDLPDMYGTIDTSHAVKAARGAHVFMGPNSSVATAGVVGGTGVNDVSADDGATLVAQAADGTRINGGSPTALGARLVPLVMEMAGAFVPSVNSAGRWYNDTGSPVVIHALRLVREFAGTAGASTVDVLVNGVTVFAVPGDRPSILFSAGDNATALGVIPPGTNIPVGGYVQVDIVAAETGATNLQLLLTGSV